jgi:tRNA (uracil-5-)-methyltransferase
VHRSPPEHYRSRCEFAVWHDGNDVHYHMYESVKGMSKPQPKVIEQYPVAHKAINEMMPVVLDVVRAEGMLRLKLFQVNYHCTLSGQAMVTLVYHKKLAAMEEQWKSAAAKLR